MSVSPHQRLILTAFLGQLPQVHQPVQRQVLHLRSLLRLAVPAREQLARVALVATGVLTPAQEVRLRELAAIQTADAAAILRSNLGQVLRA